MLLAFALGHPGVPADLFPAVKAPADSVQRGAADRPRHARTRTSAWQSLNEPVSKYLNLVRAVLPRAVGRSIRLPLPLVTLPGVGPVLAGNGDQAARLPGRCRA